MPDMSKRAPPWRGVVTTLFIVSVCACSRRQSVRATPTPDRGALASAVTPPDASSAAPRGVVTVGLSVNLPAPFHSESAENAQRIVARPEGASLVSPPGTRVDAWATNLDGVRWIAPAAGDDVFATDSREGRLLVLRDANRDGVVDARERFVFARGLSQPFGVAVHPSGHVYVANTDGVVRYPYQPGQTAARGRPERVCDLPGRGYNQHWTRNLAFSPDGHKLYVTVGSETNVDVEEDARRAAISEYDPDGSHHRVYAGGLRNPIGLAFNPVTGALFTVVNERDGLGDDLVPDYLTAVREGGFYGWPWAYFGANEDPRRRGERPDMVQRAIVPDMALGAHVAALGLVFVTRDEAMRGDALVSLHGSWNRHEPAGYKVVRVHFRDGVPTGEMSDLVAGWTLGEGRVWGRPVGLLERPDGSVLIVDDGSRTIWRFHRTP